MKRISSFLLAVVMVFSILGSVTIVYAQSWKVGDNITISINGNVLTVSGKGDMVDYKSVAEVPKDWGGSYNPAIEEIVIEDGVTSIGNFSLSNYIAVQNVTIANTVTRIGVRAFSGCLNIKSINIPASVEEIGDYALSTSAGDSSKLEKITVDSGNKYFTVEDGILYNVTKTVLYKIPSKLGIEELDVRPSVITIKGEAAIACISLREVNLPESVSKVESKAFSECTKLAKVVVNNRECDLALASIPNNAGLKLYGYSGTSVELYAQTNNYSNIEFIPLHEHNYNTVVIEPTCTEQGYTTYICECGHTYVDDYVDAKGHKAEIDARVEPTCTAKGRTEGSHCSVCGEVLVAQEDIDALGHDHKATDSTAADCMHKGTTTYTCTRCGDSYIIEDDFGLHNVVIDEAVEATCTETGLTEGSHCSVCNEVFVEQETVAMKAHSYDGGEVTKSATCTETGIMTYTCENCGETKTETIEKTAHTIVTDEAVAATCTKTGLTEGKHCSVCGEVLVKQNVVDAKGHKEVIDKAVAATCTKTGKTAGSHCSVCGQVITAQKTVAKKEHTYKPSTTKATTSKNGSIVTKCTVCGAKKSTTTIYYPKTIKLSATSYTYDGKVKKPSVTVTDSKGKKIAASNYTVTYSNGRKNVGQYTVTIKFKGNYSGTVKKTFTIKPKSTTLSSITAKSKGFTVKWKKQATQTTGYQIQYSTYKNFAKNNKTVTVSKNSTTSKTISKLTGKKLYYVRIRTYKTVNINGKSTKIYSAWSKVKTVTTKK